MCIWKILTYRNSKRKEIFYNNKYSYPIASSQVPECTNPLGKLADLTSNYLFISSLVVHDQFQTNSRPMPRTKFSIEQLFCTKLDLHTLKLNQPEKFCTPPQISFHLPAKFVLSRFTLSQM